MAPLSGGIINYQPILSDVLLLCDSTPKSIVCHVFYFKQQLQKL